MTECNLYRKPRRSRSVWAAARVVESVLVSLALLVSLDLASAQESADTFLPWHAVSTRTVVSVKLSPTGSHVAYVVAVPRKPLVEDSGSSWTELHVLPLADPDGQSLPYVTGKVNVAAVAWTPDGSEITFLTKREGDDHGSLYSLPLGGGEARRILEHETSIRSYQLSPDGEKVVFLAQEKRSSEKEGVVKKGFNQKIFEEDNLYTRLFLFGLDETDNPAKQVDIDGEIRTARFTPSGDRLVITSTPTPLVDDGYVAQTLRVIDLEGNVLTIVKREGKLGKVLPAPKSSSSAQLAQLAMIAAVDRNDPREGRLMVVRDGGTTVDLLPDLQGHVSDFTWKDDQTLAYIADVGAETRVGTATVDGTDHATLVEEGKAIFTAIHAAGEASIALVTQHPRHPRELYTLDGSGALSRRTHSNSWLEKIRLARQQVMSYKASDGLDLAGVLIYPLDYREGTRYPLILVAHGGPESHYRNGWLSDYSHFGQIAAARGCAVYYPNYRGSTGRGVEFSKVSQADAAGKEFSDLVDAVDHLIQIGLIDENRVGITGASYGGYASAWATTYYSERFAAAIPFVGISDNVSKVGTTDIPQEMYDVHHRKWLWEDWQYFVERSPIYYATRNRTPTLILHGSNDPRVHPSQSMELYRHLKVLDQAPVRLVFYPGEGHGNRKSAARFDYLLRTLRWMEHYLKGDGGAPPDYEIDYEAWIPEGELKEKKDVKSEEDESK